MHNPAKNTPNFVLGKIGALIVIFFFIYLFQYMKSQDSKLNAEVQKLAGDLSLHLAAMKPNYLTEQDVPQDVRNKVMEDLTSEEEKKRALDKLFS